MASGLSQWIDIIRNHVSQEDESNQHKLFRQNAWCFHPKRLVFSPKTLGVFTQTLNLSTGNEDNENGH